MNFNNDIKEKDMVNDLPLTPEEKSESEEEEVSEEAFLIDNDKIAKFEIAWQCYGEKIVTDRQPITFTNLLHVTHDM